MRPSKQPDIICQTNEGTPKAIDVSLIKNVNAKIETTRLTVVMIGLNRSTELFEFVDAEPPTITGRSGSMHGAAIVSMPAKNDAINITTLPRGCRGQQKVCVCRYRRQQNCQQNRPSRQRERRLFGL